MAKPVFAIEVRTRLGGAPPQSSALDSVYLRLTEEQLTLADLIRRTVEEQVRELLAQKLDVLAIERALDRCYLTDDEVSAQAERDGAVRLPKRRLGQIDAEVEVGRALAAFESRSYVVFVDGRQVENLEAKINMRLDTRVTFLRLMPLAGGA